MAKVALYIDDEVWRRFKEAVFRKHGTLRRLSKEVEALVRSTLTAEALLAGFQRLGADGSKVISAAEVKARAPKLRGPPAEAVVRAMRQRRLANLSP